MTIFVALYRGPSVQSARLVAVSGDPVLVADVSARLLQEANQRDSDQDPVIASLQGGRRDALRLIKQETKGQSHKLEND